MTRVPNLQGARVTVIGLGIEGIDLVRYLTAQGASVTVSDARPVEQLDEALAAIADCDPNLSLGENRFEDATGADAVFVSQGVPADLPALRAARRAEVPISSMSQLFLERCPAPVAGITGSSGKTTTTALTGAMLDAAGLDHVVGGNIGVGLLGLLDQIEPETKVVVELSHTQLEMVEQSPELACVTNVTPNHLDQYSWASYVSLKRRIFQFQDKDDLAIFNLDDEVCAGFVDEAHGRVAYTSATRDLPGDGALLEGDMVVRRGGGTDHELLRRDEIALRGEHNVANVLSAATIATRLGVGDAAIAEAVRSFNGVPHRLEPIATVRDVVYVNDSIATTPERTLAGLRSFEESLVLLLGGRDKHLPLREMAALAVERCRAVVTFGEAGDLFADAVREARDGDAPSIECVEDLPTAVRHAAERAQAGDVVLFSPAGTSFDAYRTFEARGADFRAAVAGLEGNA
jgi:UDP-N-acetylmuramoylalanine--D-glutamate ligase